MRNPGSHEVGVPRRSRTSDSRCLAILAVIFAFLFLARSALAASEIVSQLGHADGVRDERAQAQCQYTSDAGEERGWLDISRARGPADWLRSRQ
jgi:hypothetical protein